MRVCMIIRRGAVCREGPSCQRRFIREEIARGMRNGVQRATTRQLSLRVVILETA